jgi:hypothetical protein
MHCGRMIEAIRPFFYVSCLFRLFATSPNQGDSMTWIKTVRMDEDERVKHAMESQRKLYPIEYATPVASVDSAGDAAGITAAHTLLPDALYHSFSTFGVLLSPDLPLTRDQHEMIATMVSVTNRCHY